MKKRQRSKQIANPSGVMRGSKDKTKSEFWVMDIRGHIHAWVKDVLTNRAQLNFVKINGIFRAAKCEACGLLAWQSLSWDLSFS